MVKLTFGERVDDLVREHEGNQANAAREMDMTASVLSDIINDKKSQGVRVPTLKKLCEHYHVSADYLLGLTDVRSPDVEIQAVCNTLGITEKTYETLLSLQREGKDTKLSLINRFISESTEMGIAERLRYIAYELELSNSQSPN